MPAEFFEPLSNHAAPPVYTFFDGTSWNVSSSGKTVDVHSPIDGSLVGSLQVVTSAEVDVVVKRAAVAQRSWESTPLNERVKIMHLAADWVRHFQDFLTSQLVREIGKTVSEAKSEVVRTAEIIDYSADIAQSLKGETVESDAFPAYDKGRIAVIERAAHGVVAAIAPFNYPINLSASKIAPALLMGNSVVFKPPTQGGISGLHLARIFEKAGLPPGVFSCITGGGAEIGDALVSHPSVAMIAFTGNSDTGMAIAAKAPMKQLLFECGGNNPTVIFPDADMTLTAREVVKGGFSYAGQRCTAIKYVLASRGVLDQFIPVLEQQMKELVHPGDPRSPETKMVGPVISEKVADTIQSWIDASVAAGAKILLGGHHTGAYMEPTILTSVTPDMPVIANEVFGPVVSLIEIKSNDEAIAIINGMRFGLQASVFTRDEGTGMMFARQLNVGTVQLNGSPQRGPDHFPFLGVKQSGIGVQGIRYSLEAMSRLRPIVMNKPQ